MAGSREDAEKLVGELLRVQRFPTVMRQDVLFEALRENGYEDSLIVTVLTDVSVGALNRLNYCPEILVGLDAKEDVPFSLPFPLGFDRSGPPPICCFGLPQPEISEKGTAEIVYSHCPEKGDANEFVKKYRCVSFRKTV